MGRWHVPDPLAEYHFNMNPYHYVFNNPMMFTDPFGLDSIAPNNPGGANNPIPLPEVTVKRQGWIKRPLKKIGNALRKGDQAVEGDNTYTTPGGTEYTSSSGGGNENHEAENPDGQSENIDLILAQKVAGPKPPPSPLDAAKSIKSVSKAGQEINNATSGTSDEDIVSSSTGTSPAASPENNTIVRAYSGYDSDSADVSVLMHRTDEGDTLRVKRRHRGTLKGRYITEPFFKNKKNNN